MMTEVLGASWRTVAQLEVVSFSVLDVVTGDGGLAGVVGSGPGDCQRGGGAGYRHHDHIADGGRGLGEGRSGERGQREHAAEGGPREGWEPGAGLGPGSVSEVCRWALGASPRTFTACA